MKIGDNTPDFTFECTDPKVHAFKDFPHKYLVLYFYPKDNTPGCTLEGKDFRDLYASFLAHDTQVIGISRDTLSSHTKFSTNCEFPFPLIADTNQTLCKQFGVLIKKNMFKRIVFGIERTTFLLDPERKIKHIWPNVRVKGHAQAVLAFIKSI